MSKSKDKPGNRNNRHPEEIEDMPEVDDFVEDTGSERDELLDRLMRLQAEYENYRKRMAREKSEWSARAKEGLVLDLLPVLDSFDRAISTAGESADPKALLEGMDLVMRQLSGALKNHGVTPIDAVGEAFDPNLHEAFLSRPAAESEAPGTLVAEILKGYRMGERTIRPTRGMIAVAEEKKTDPDEGPEEE
jgi:molecular chaperone GrpE